MISMKDKLKRCIEEGKLKNKTYLGVKIMMKGFDRPEVNIHRIEDIDILRIFNDNVYDDNLVLTSFNKIKIIDFICSDSYSEIEEKLAND